MTRESSLVTAQWVEEHLDDPNIVLVEVDEDTTAYDKGHIKGAIKLDWTTDLQDQVRRDFVSKAQFEALLSGRGVANDDTVVLYGGNNNWFAAYAYWYFKLYGHQDVKLLDGGRKKWELDSRELTDELPTREQDVVHRPGAGRLDPRVPRRDRGRDRRPRTWSTCAAPTSTPAGCSPRPTSRRSRRSAPGHVPTVDQRAVEQGGERRRHLQVRRRAARALRRGRPRLTARTPSPMPHRRALLAHVVRAQGAARATRTSRTTTAPGPSTARWSASPWPSATSRVKPDVRRDQGRPLARRRQRRQGGGDPGPGAPRRRSRSATPTSDCSTAPVSSPPRSRPRPPATSGSSPARVTGRCAPWPRRPSRSTTPCTPRSAPSPR